jgi:hypothetical protein
MVLDRADFDLSEVSPLQAVARVSCPTVFGHAENDQFVPFPHLRRLYDASCNPEKYLLILDGGHNSRRERAWLELAISFALARMDVRVKQLRVIEARRLQGSTDHFESFKSLIANTRQPSDVDPELKRAIAQMPEAAGALSDPDDVASEPLEPPEPPEHLEHLEHLEPPEPVDTGREEEPAIKRHRKRHKRPAETQTYDLFGLPPLSESLAARLPPEWDKE